MCHPENSDSRAEAQTAPRVLVPLPDEQMPGWLAAPGGDGRRRVLIVHDVFGPSAFYQDLAIRLENAGFLALLPDFFFREGPLEEASLPAAYERLSHANDHRLLRDAHAAAHWLRHHDDPVDRIGIIGFCWGGTQVLVMAAERRDVATVCYYGMPADPKYFSDPQSPRPLDLVDSITGSVLGLWGDQDTRAGMDNVREFLEVARLRGVDVEGHIFPGAGHGFMSRAGGPDDPVSKAVGQAWDRTIGFLTDQLREDVDG